MINAEEDASGDPLILAAVAVALTIGVLSSQIATNVYNEIRAAEEQDEEVDSGTIANDIYNIFAGMFGFKERQEESSAEWNLLNSLRLDLNEAWERVADVVKDELSGQSVIICDFLDNFLLKIRFNDAYPLNDLSLSTHSFVLYRVHVHAEHPQLSRERYWMVMR